MSNMEFSNIVVIFLNTIVVIIVLMYLLFAVILVRQVSLMGQVIITGVDKYVKAMALIHLAFAFIVALFLINTLLL